MSTAAENHGDDAVRDVSIPAGIDAERWERWKKVGKEHGLQFSDAVEVPVTLLDRRAASRKRVQDAWTTLNAIEEFFSRENDPVIREHRRIFFESVAKRGMRYTDPGVRSDAVNMGLRLPLLRRIDGVLGARAHRWVQRIPPPRALIAVATVGAAATVYGVATGQRFLAVACFTVSALADLVDGFSRRVRQDAHSRSVPGGSARGDYMTCLLGHLCDAAVLYALAELTPSLRPFAELIVPLTLFASLARAVGLRYGVRSDGWPFLERMVRAFAIFGWLITGQAIVGIVVVGSFSLLELAIVAWHSWRQDVQVVTTWVGTYPDNQGGIGLNNAIELLEFEPVEGDTYELPERRRRQHAGTRG